MRYLDVCAGISASTVAWRPLGWQAAAYSEIEAAPRAVLAHHYPDTPLHGDFTTIRGDEYGAIDLLVGGTPCQDFSVAGLRAGLDGDRGNLSLEFLRLADRTRPRWVVWENVPGVLSIDGGRAFGAILGGLGELGYGFAYRILDAQFFGVPQRRRRVFVVGYLGNWRGAAAVLSERNSLSGHPAPRKSKGTAVAALTSAGVGTCGADDNQAQAGHLIPLAFGGNDTRGPIDVSTALNSHGGPHGRQDFESETFVLMERGREGVPNLEWRADGTANAILTPNGGRGGLGVGAVCIPEVAHALRGEGFDASEDGTGRGTPLVPVAFTTEQTPKHNDDCALTLTKQSPTGGGQIQSVAIGSAVRRLTPREYERLQGFPDTQRTAIITVCEGVKSDHAKSARQSSLAPRRDPSAPVAVSVLIDLEQEVVALRNLDGSSWSASTAEPANSSPLSMPADAFARLAAHTLISLVPATDAGAEVLLANSKGSSPLWSGSASVSAFGREIAALVSDAERFTSEANRLSRFTTSPLGPDTQTCEQTLETWSCCVCAAISGFIPEQIRNASSYAISVEVRAGYTLVPHRGKPMADGPRYKALGNSMAVPVMAWIGQRIAAVDALMTERAAA